jgi:tetratricopeptide (TPR) repeat protein
VLLARQGRLVEAVDHYEAALRLDPASADAHYDLAAAAHRLGRLESAVEHYREALRLRPGFTSARVGLAWVRAAAEDPALRDGAEAVRLALEAQSAVGAEAPELLDLLAAGHAELGDPAEAVRLGERALAGARAAGRSDLSAAIERRLERYRAGLPFRGDPAAVNGPSRDARGEISGAGSGSGSP